MKKKSISEDKRIEGQDVSEEKSRDEKVKSGKKIRDQKKESAMEEEKGVEQESFNEGQSSVVSTKESKGKTKESKCLIENHESLKEEENEEKQDESENSEETKEEKSSILFEGDKGEEMKESCCDISSPLNSLSSEEVNSFTNSNKHFLSCFSPCVRKFEAQNMEIEGILCYKLYKTISFIPSTSFLFFDFIINEYNCCSFPIFSDRIQSQLFNFLTTTCGTKPNRGMKAKEERIGKDISIGYEYTPISLSLQPFLLCHELTFKE
ncbi:hypothetical protein M9H77_03737 [Catharanthus roseus]|uniref:Uncharacterized protein n=1 Tax=Catharanthus roseus TaxID=4058 RepID=A0ACC0CC90_CATRO|nr:hypothetical protein M9H77_03737 [Catharanthus roseus]